MSITNAQGHHVPGRYDHNNDGVFNHDDVVAYINDVEAGNIKGSPRFLLSLQKAGGEVTAQDWLELAEAGGKGDGSHILKWAEAGGTLNQEQLSALRAKGVEFTSKELTAIETKFGIPHTSRFPPGTTVEDVLKMADAGVKITADDLISLKKTDGSPAFVDIKDLIKLEEKGCDVTGEDLIAFQKIGGNFNGDHLVDFVKAGGDITEEELVALAKGGCQIYEDDLKTIISDLGLKLTAEQYMAINPVKVADETHEDNYAPGFTM